jgi:hypothetical protein
VQNSLLAGKKSREFSPIQPFFATFVSKTFANAMVCRRIPYASEQGIFSREQGIDSARREFFAKSICPPRRVQFHLAVD